MSNRSNPVGWTDARTETLAALWRDGLSAAQIAGELGGITRNAVIGKLHRLGLAGRAKPATPRRARALPTLAASPRRLTPPRPITSTPPAPAPTGPGLAADLVALAPNGCRWPIGDPKAADFSFCGRTAVAGGPYCVGHRSHACRPGSARPLEDDPWLLRLLGGAVA
jgi:GcrA cell cycle regulator